MQSPLHSKIKIHENIFKKMGEVKKMTNISNSMVTKLSQYGITVYRETNPVIIDKYNTDVFISKPNQPESFVPWYNELWEVPVLPSGSECSVNMDNNQMPTETQKEDYGVYIHLDPDQVAPYSKHGMELKYKEMRMNGQSVPWYASVLIMLIWLAIAFVVCYFIFACIDRVNIVHGKDWQIQKVDDETKALTKPNCQAALWDAVNHEFVEGDSWSEPNQSPGNILTDWVKYIFYGVVAIGVVYLGITLLKSRERKEYYQAYPSGYGYEPPPPPPQKGIFERGIEKAGSGISKGAKYIGRKIK